jgi:acetoin utilization deacetylase AcuC-like enzyme
MFKIAWNNIYCHPLPQGHRFPMEKYNLLPQQLLYEGTINAHQILNPMAMDDDIILLTHESLYLNKLNHLGLTAMEIRKTGFPLSRDLVDREKVIMQGTLEAALCALNDGIGFNVAGGTHHAFTNRGEGFCLLNDMAIAANFLLHKNLVKQVLVVDLDVHQGNGTAQIFENNKCVFTFSMHGKKNYPLQKEKSDIDIELDDFTDDRTYLRLLGLHLNQIVTSLRPDFIFYQAGVDILAEDKLGRLSISLEACKLRDKLVFEIAKRHQIPIAVTMGGGYAPQIKTIIEAHANTFRLARDMFE